LAELNLKFEEKIFCRRSSAELKPFFFFLKKITKNKKTIDERFEDSSLASLQEKFILEESVSFLKKVLKAAEASLESQKILML
jgi:hypothetical protein